MQYSKIRLPKSELGSQAFVELAKSHRVVGIHEHGEVVYQVPAVAIEILDRLSLPYEVLASGLPVATRRPDPGRAI